MAIIQISKIQQRYGKKTDFNVSQLSTAELAWVTDSQELYIGNGSTDEGAPYVGHTKILTQHDNLAAYIGSYKYSNNDSKSRTYQSKLDEYVSVLDFGADPTNTNDSTTAFQNAITQLQNTGKKLFIPVGVYKISSLSITNHISIVGESKLQSIVNLSDTLSLSGYGVMLEDFSIVYGADASVNISGLSDSEFNNIIFTTATTPIYDSIQWSDSTNILTDNVSFSYCTFKNLSTCISALSTVQNNNKITIDHCTFTTNTYAIKVSGSKSSWVISNCNFNGSKNEAIKSISSSGMVVSNCAFKQCGTNGQVDSIPTINIISFSKNTSNLVKDCIFYRRQTNTSTTSYLCEVKYATLATLANQNSLGYPILNTAPLVFDIANTITEIDYTLSITKDSITYIRTGKLTMTNDLNNVTVTDSYSVPNDTLDNLLTSSNFSATVSDDKSAIFLTSAFGGIGYTTNLQYTVTYKN